jgi:nucleoside-diphosphate-sugar epimerase
MTTKCAEIPSLVDLRVLVTGGSGFLGSHLVEHLAREGAIVAALARTEGKLPLLNKNTNFAFYGCDLTDETGTIKALKSFAPQVVFHLAAMPDANECLRQSKLTIHNNLISTVNTLEAFRLCGPGLLVYIDTCKVYGLTEVPYRENMAMKPISSYAIAKAAAWEFCCLYNRLYGIPTVCVRPTTIYGPRQNYNLISFVVESVLSNKQEIRLCGGDQTRDLLFIDDAIEAFLIAAKYRRGIERRVINIGGGLELSVVEITRRIMELMESRLPIIEDTNRARPTDMLRSYCDNIEAMDMLGWRPKTSLKTGLIKTIPSLISNLRSCDAGK